MKEKLTRYVEKIDSGNFTMLPKLWIFFFSKNYAVHTTCAKIYTNMKNNK